VKVLFATDGAEPSEHAAHLLARLADPVRTAVTVLSVNDAGSCPVLVAHEAPEPDRRLRVIVGADGSDGSNHAMAAFAALADPARSEVTVVTAVTALALPPGGPAGAAIEPDVADGETALAGRLAAAASDVLKGSGFRVEIEVQTGAPAAVLLEQAERRGADLVVVGARGLGRIAAKVLGSVSDRIIRSARATLVGR
jgi:nucleotide-binding universal stress UspA family protein